MGSASLDRKSLPVFIRRITKHPYGKDKPYGSNPLVFWGLFSACGLFAASPFFVPEYLPLQDLPANLSYAAIIHYYDMATNPYDHIYKIGGLSLPNGMALYLTSWLANLLTILGSARLILGATAFLLPLSLLALLRVSGKNPWWSFAGFSLVLNYPLACGYFPFTLALPVLVFALALSCSYFKRPSIAKGIGLAVLSWLVFWAHAQAFLYLGLLLILPGMFFLDSWKGFMSRLLPFVPSLSLASLWALRQYSARPADAATLAMTSAGSLKPVWSSPWDLVVHLPDHTIQRFAGFGEEMVFVVLLCAAAVSVFHYLKQVILRGGLDFDKSFPGILLTGALLCMFALPYRLYIHTGLNTRMVPLAFLFAMGLGGSPKKTISRSLLFGLLIASGIWSSVFASDRYAKFQAEEAGDVMELIDSLPDATYLAYIDLDDGTSRIVQSGKGVFWHTGAYHIVLNQGVTFSHFHRYYGRHVEYLTGKALPEPKPPVRRFLASKACQRYEYLLLKTPRPIEISRYPGLLLLGKTMTFSLWKIAECHSPQSTSTKVQSNGPTSLPLPPGPPPRAKPSPK